MTTKQTTDQKRRAELKELAEVVSVALTSTAYVPTLHDPAQADAFDAAMQSAGDRRRAWRGSAKR